MLAFIGLVPFAAAAGPSTPLGAPPEVCGPEGTLLAVRRSPEIVSWSLLASGAKGGANAAYSGLSLAQALSLAKVGATGDVAAELQRVLGIAPNVECGPTALAGAWKATTDDLAKADKTVRWKLAIGAWLAKDLHPKKLWSAMATGEFDAKLAQVDFSKERTHAEVNAWVKKRTEGKIETILPEPLSPDTAFVLANALFFDAEWSQSFPREKTKEAPFHGTAGDKPVPMMELTGRFGYLANEEGQLVRLPYGKAQAFEMAVWLPKDGKKLGEVLTEAGRQSLDRALDAIDAPSKGTVRMPRFKVDAFTPDLSDALKALGAEKTLEFTKDWTLLAPDRELRVSKVAHRVVVDVAERGTTVAAATAVVAVKRGAMLEKKPFVFTADRPFVYLVRHRPTNVWVVTGVYQAP